MTIKELIESNSFIGDITIDIRGRSKTVTPGFENQQTFSQLEQDWHIGYEEGKKPPYPSEKGIYIEKSINKYDDGEDYYDLTVSRIPDEVEFDLSDIEKLMNHYESTFEELFGRDNAAVAK